MTNYNLRKRWMVSLAVVIMAGSLTACKGTEKKEQTPTAVPTFEVTQAPTQAPQTIEKDQAAQESLVKDNDVAYIKEYFDIAFEQDTVDANSFNDALQKLGCDVKVEGELTYLSAVKAAMQAAKFDELVLSYPQEKVAERLNHYEITDVADETLAPYLACAVDAGFITKTDAQVAAKNEALTKTQAQYLVVQTADVSGKMRNYLAESNDIDIYAKLNDAWNTFMLFDDEKLAEIGKTAVQNKVVTGYNVKNNAFSARFLPELTLQYGHSDITHAHQLMALLNSENIVAKVALEPKVSVYEYLLDWGPVPESTPTYQVKKFSDDLYLCYAVEYDMQLEFENKEDMLRFDEVINAYAKKWEGNEEAKGLIYASWWQPLYSTVKMDMPSESYYEIGDLCIDSEGYSLHTFYLPADKETVINKMQELAGDLAVSSTERTVNKAFYNYLTGADFQ